MRSTRELRVPALLAALGLALAPAVAGADEMVGGGFAVPTEEERADRCADSLRHRAGYGFAAFLGTVSYGPLKTVYAILGTAASGLAWAFTLGNADTAREVAGPALAGDYVLTCEHMTGERPIELFGRGSY